jgi:uncharacterized protein (DUF433 family)
MSDLLARITIHSKQCRCRPCIRGMRIRVSDILDLFVAGLDAEQILAEMPDLEADDLNAALLYASRKLDSTEKSYENLCSTNKTYQRRNR